MLAEKGQGGHPNGAWVWESVRRKVSVKPEEVVKGQTMGALGMKQQHPGGSQERAPDVVRSTCSTETRAHRLSRFMENLPRARPWG